MKSFEDSQIRQLSANGNYVKHSDDTMTQLIHI